jgi:DNA invertase Pin-like site-specific DNA recombinase
MRRCRALWGPDGRQNRRPQGNGKSAAARVSTTGQDTATQEAKLKAAGCTLIRTEIVSGGSRNGRNELASILDFIRPADVLIVVKLDRLGRNTRDVLNLVHELEEKGASLRVLEPATGGPMGRMVLTVLGMVAEMELGFIRDRQRAGIDAAKAKAFTRSARPLSIALGSYRCARKEWAPVRSARPSGGSGLTEFVRCRWGHRSGVVVGRGWGPFRSSARNYQLGPVLASQRCLGFWVTAALARAPALFKPRFCSAPSLRLPICDAWRHPAAVR